MSQGRYLTELTAAIRDVLPQKCRAHLDSWMENGVINLTPRDMGTGVNVGQLQYEAVILVENLPFREFNPANILATVAGWLQDNDDSREALGLPDPQFEVSPLDDNRADVSVSVTFSEPMRLVEDAAGPVRYDGRRWRVEDYTINTAEDGRVYAGSLPGGPLDGETDA